MCLEEKYNKAYSTVGKDVEFSISLYEEILSEKEDYPSANHDLSIAYSKVGKYDLARKYAQNQIKYYEEDYRSYCCMGYVSYKEKKYEECIQWYEKSLNYEEFSGAYQNIGLSHIKLGDFKKGKIYIEKALEIDTHPNFVFLLGVSNVAVGEYEEAKRCFKRLKGNSDKIKISKVLIDEIDKNTEKEEIDELIKEVVDII